MDPFIEGQKWEDFHASFITAIRDVLVPAVRPRYIVDVERRIYLELSDPAEPVQMLVAGAAIYHRVDHLSEGSVAVANEPSIKPKVCTLPYFEEHRETFITIRRGSPARVVTVASLAHTMGKLVFDDLHMERRYKQFRAYGTSKLCNVLFARELARRLAGTGVTSNALHPGTVASNFGSTGSWLFRIGPRLVRPFLLSTVRGARTSIHCAASPDVEGVTGEYFDRCKVARTSRAARDPELAKKLWEVSEALCGVKWS